MSPCTVCKSLQCSVDTDGSPNDERIAYNEKDALIESAEKGCSACSILWEAIRAFEPLIGPLHSTWVLRVREGILGISYDVCVDDQGTGSKWAKELHFYLTGGFVPQWPALGRARDATGDTASIEYIRQMKDWLETCGRDHKLCAPDLQLSSLPTRVLDVSDGCIRLHESNGQKDRYIALSHCWGTFQILCTLSTNIDKHSNSIEIADLSKTFQDAVELTRAIEIRYLWIDSLCIIQDSKEDWDRESSLMAGVYGNSYLTVLATASRDGRGGLFRRPDPSMKKIQIQRYIDGQKVTINVRQKLSHSPYWNFKIKLGDPVIPLLERSWCFQEFILSPRIAHFSQEEILWSCGQGKGCNCGLASKSPEGRELLKSQIAQALEKPDEQIDNIFCSVGNRIHAVWWNLVGAYTTKSLTYDKDRLPALSGVAKLIQQHSKDEYLAGMWKSNLADELFWRVLSNSILRDNEVIRTESCRPTEYRAPSWSWASVNARIDHIGIHDAINRSEILEAKCKPAGADSTGAVASGFISVKGILVIANAWFDEDEALYYVKHANTRDTLPTFMWEADVKGECAAEEDDPLDVAVLWWSWSSQNEASALVLQPTNSGDYQRLGILATDDAFVGEEYDWDVIQGWLRRLEPRTLKII